MKTSRSARRLCTAVGLAVLGGWAAAAGSLGLMVRGDERMAKAAARRNPWVLPPVTVRPWCVQPVCAYGIVGACWAGAFALRRREDRDEAAAARGSMK